MASLAGSGNPETHLWKGNSNLSTINGWLQLFVNGQATPIAGNAAFF